jgi:dihydrofolate synthase/folylpolyglutamate synthase
MRQKILQIKNLNDAIEYLYSFEFKGIKLGLSNVIYILNELSNPQNELKFIHLSGTNGKGSTGAMISSALTHAKQKTAFYTSPHLIDIRERFRIDGKIIAESLFIDSVNKLKNVLDNTPKDYQPTFFEVTTILAIIIFHKENVDFVVWETGLGGRFDATNVVNSICSIITNISLDHCSFLGNTIRDITFEKAGIIKENQIVFIGNHTKESEDVIYDVASRNNSTVITTSSKEITILDKKINKIEIDSQVITMKLKGEFQINNLKLALTVFEWIAKEYSLDYSMGINGLEKVSWPGRFHIIDKLIVDGAHNYDAAKLLVDNIKSLYPNQLFTIVFANFEDKDTESIIAELSNIANKFIFLEINGHRKSCPTEKMEEILAKLKLNIDSCKANDITDALKQLNNNEYSLIAGSLFLAGEALNVLNKKDDTLNIY